MPKIAYIAKNFRYESLRIIAQATEIADEYDAQGFSLTLRQLYYQFVARGLLANNQKSYDRLGSIINDARLAGLFDWDMIEDRTRNVRNVATWDNGADILKSAANQFRLDPWKDQDCLVECWIEKDALLGVIERTCRDLRIPYYACRGYNSQSEQWRASVRAIESGKRVVILHLGDHDPSGLDMTRDIEDRFRTFHADEVEVRRLALNFDQVEEYSPPPNPAKMTDSRAGEYVARYGSESWELDALSPPVIDALIRAAVEPLLDQDAWDATLAREDEERERIVDFAERFTE